MLTITPKNGKGTNAYNNKNVVVLNLSSIRSFFLQALIAIFTGKNCTFTLKNHYFLYIAVEFLNNLHLKC